MYELSRGPLVWIAFAIFLFGSVYRMVSMARMARKDKVVWPYMRWGPGLRSIKILEAIGLWNSANLNSSSHVHPRKLVRGQDANGFSSSSRVSIIHHKTIYLLRFDRIE